MSKSLRIENIFSDGKRQGMSSREKAEVLWHNEAMLKNAQRIARFGSWELDLTNLKDINENPLYWSDEVFRIFGYRPGEIEASSENFFRSVHPEDREAVSKATAGAVSEGRDYVIVHRIIRPDGTVRYVHEEAQVFKDSISDRPIKMIGIVQDITEQKEGELRLKRLNRLYSVLSKINEAIVRTKDEKTLCQKACQIAVEQGQLRMAWVGEVDAESKLIVPFVFAGVDDGYLAIVNISSEEGPAGNGPGGYAIRENKPCVCQDIATDPHLEAWREPALERGYRSIAALPLQLGKGRRGLMAFYASEPNFFNKEELDLFSSMLENMVFALDSIQKENQRIETEQALRKSEEHYRLLFFDNPHPMWVYDLETLVFLAVNATAKLQYGYTEEEFLAMTVRDIRPPEELARFDASLDELRTRSISKSSLPARHRKKNGQIIDVEISSDTITFNGRLARLVAATDITERKVFEQKLAEQAALIDQARDAIVLRDMEGIVLFWNKAAERIYGWTVSEAVGRPISNLIYRNSEKYNFAVLSTIARGEWSGELEHLTKLGEQVIVEARWSLLRDAQGKPQSILAINTDVTERKKVEAHLLRAQRMESIGTLAGGIAHDLNNLLAPIIMGVDLLKHFGATGPSLKVVEDIERSAKRGSSLVKQVLSFARGVEGARVAVAVQDLISELESIIGNTFPKDIVLETRLVRDLPLVEGDPTQLNQVLLNLCVNSRDAMPSGGRLIISAESAVIDAQFEVMKRGIAAGQYVCIEVADNGVGIPSKNLDKIFDPFFTTKELTKGTGLGLATTLGIVRSHGGFLNVYSEVNRGTTFKVYLPAQASGVKAEAPMAENDDWPRGSGEWILLVDDETSILTITQQTLEAFGYRVLTAENGAQAVSLYAVHRDKIALVLTDMMMPVMDGLSTILALRQINPAIKFVAASGMNANANIAKAAHVGVKQFLAKPYTTGTMLTAIKTALAEAS